MKKRYKKLTFNDRQMIERMVKEKVKPKEIADVAGVCHQTIYRELARGKDKSGVYKAEIAQRSLFCPINSTDKDILSSVKKCC